MMPQVMGQSLIFTATVNCRRRSAGFEPAVSPISNRLPPAIMGRVELGCASVISERQQVKNLRYSRLKSALRGEFLPLDDCVEGDKIF
jgi:hypothetical protein